MRFKADDRLILALDQGTTSSRAIAFDRNGWIVAQAQHEFTQHYPAPGQVEHDPEELWSSQLHAARDVVAAVGGPERIAALGIANQRETSVVWDRATGQPIGPAIVWQSRVTAGFCDELRRAGVEPMVRARTGLPIDPYFSGPKLRHILLEADAVERARTGGLCFGTIDSFLVWRLTGGRVHATDVSNASRTLLFDIHTLQWDPELLALMEVPETILPEVRASSGDWGRTDPAIFGIPIPIRGVAGDQQAATFGQACFLPGEAKTTYGTGAFLLLHVGQAPVASENGLLSTVLWQLDEGGPVEYALEGGVFVAGAAVQWLRDGLRAIATSDEIERLIGDTTDTADVYLVPAFVGLGAPWWDPHARGLLIGLTLGTGLPQIARATLESIAYQVHDVVEAMVADRGAPLREMRADGGAARNDALLQFQADLLGTVVERPASIETTAWGAAALAGLAAGTWSDLDELRRLRRVERRFEPGMASAERERRLRGWHRAVERSRGWTQDE